MEDDLSFWAEHVPDAYNRIADAFSEIRRASAEHGFHEQQFLDRLVAPLSVGARVLDVGCGPGVPSAAYLTRRGFEVTGLDASREMLNRAKDFVPAARFVLGDMRTADIDGPFDAIVAWDSVFHIPREEQAGVFDRFAGWLRPGGRLLVSLAGSAADDFTSDMMGETFYYSGFAPKESLAMLADSGFSIEHWEVDDPTSKGHIAVVAVLDDG